MDLEVLQRLFAFLKVLGVTQSQVAERLGVTQGLITQWVHGRRPLAERHEHALLAFLKERVEHDERQSFEAHHAIPTLGRRDKAGRFFPSKALREWQAQRQAVNEAKFQYEVSVRQTLERFAPGAGMADLRVLADEAMAQIIQYGERGQKTWNRRTRLFLQAWCERLATLFKAMDLVESVTDEKGAENDHAE